MVPRGAKSLVHRVRMWLQQAAPDHVLLHLDFRNALNSMKRKVLLHAIADSCPWFLPYASACYSHVSTLFADGGFTIDSAEGVHQVDPCGPLFSRWPSWPCPKVWVLCLAAGRSGTSMTGTRWPPGTPT